VFKEGVLAGKRVPVSGELTLGRENADVLLEDDLVSRRHALVRHTGAGLEIVDLGSSNGTFVNGARIQAPQALHDGDAIRLGGVSLVVDLRGA
jgi:pSer/pThr/pTyr-binding forkhead associated (FHA) protein